MGFFTLNSWQTDWRLQTHRATRITKLVTYLWFVKNGGLPIGLLRFLQPLLGFIGRRCDGCKLPHRNRLATRC
jgi:hypothetical protein